MANLGTIVKNRAAVIDEHAEYTWALRSRCNDSHEARIKTVRYRAKIAWCSIISLYCVMVSCVEVILDCISNSGGGRIGAEYQASIAYHDLDCGSGDVLGKD